MDKKKTLTMQLRYNEDFEVILNKFTEMIKKEVDLTPAGIIKRLDLKKPVYVATSSYGHFGRKEFSWEKLDLVDIFKKYK